jgi:carnitine-CoA ligase
VLESAAVAVPSEWGEDEVKIVVVVKPGHEVDPPALMAFLRETMPAFMVPRYVEILDELPKTPTQKIRKAVLKEAGITPGTLEFAPARSSRTLGPSAG